ncbi:DUF6894 family protein [Sphingobium chlorophenolicum]|uniref:DUF6894 domain-containing protein n=1 Tax=Sphingobium chlorophenolicum TaxID=46429 RepID=A0A081RE38_SPHCR|nr:hypothetical protein [Sphingobium chlorophenolicum]KEQ53461.1 hypothetical protein BV95_02325 [Sphingobium chlorophenolicum]
MPIFHIHLHNDEDVIDEAGQEFADAASAKAHAVRSGREIIAEHVLYGRPINLNHRLVVEDNRRQRLETVYFRDLLNIDG